MIDVGNSLGRALQRICCVADAIVMVTTSDAAAVVSTFAAIRALAHPERSQDGGNVAQPAFSLCVLVNMVQSARDAKTVHDRLVRACRRLLRIEIVGNNWNRLLNLEILPARSKKGSIFGPRWPITPRKYGHAKLC